MSGDSRKVDFFISFNKADRAWATWIAWVLEDCGYSVLFQDWDSSGSFLEQMHRAALRTDHTVVVLSDAYLASEYARSEAWAALARDPVGREDRVVVIKIGSIGNLGLFGHFSYVDLVATNEADAQCLLIERARRAVEPTYRPKPSTRPRFPLETARNVVEKPDFPAPADAPAVAVHNLPLANPDFVGRGQVLVDLRRQLTTREGPAVVSEVLSGLGGVGKSQTALAYCYRHLADYTLIWWLHAETAEVLVADFTTLAAPLGLHAPVADQAGLITSIRSTLQRRDSWLLVFDNMNSKREMLAELLPSTGKGHAIVTSRRADWQGLARSLPLKEMDETDALQLLTGTHEPSTLPPAEYTVAKALADDLGCLPLALAQARAYMSETGRSIDGYRRLLHASRPAVLARGKANSSYPDTVAKTWEISLQAAEDACRTSRPLLELLAFFGPEKLPMDVLGGAPEALPADLRDECERDDSIAALHRFSLVRAEAGTVTVHRLVQAVTRDGLDVGVAKVRAESAVRLVNAALPTMPREHTSWSAITSLLPHAIATAYAAESLDAALETAAMVLKVTALYHSARAAYAEAEPLLIRSLRIREKILGSDNRAVASDLGNLAELYHAQGRFAEAERILVRALTIHEGKNNRGFDEVDIARTIHALAELYRAQNRINEAERLHQRALVIRERTLGAKHPDVAQSLNNLAALHQDEGHFGEAESLYRRSLAIREEALGPLHPDVAWTLHALAELHRAQSRFSDAEPLLRRALTIQEKVLGPDHPDVAWSLQALAELYQHRGRYADAEAVYKRSIEIREKTLGPEHRDLARSLHGLAALYHRLGRFAEAKSLYQRSLIIRQNVLGSEHRGVAWSLQDLGRLYHDEGDYSEAEPRLTAALSLFEKIEDPAIPRSLQDLGAFYCTTGRYTEADRLLSRSLNMREKTLRPEHPDIAWSLQELGRLYREQGRDADAESLLTRALLIFEKAEDPAVPRALHELGVLYVKQGRYGEAEALLTRSLRMRQESVGPDHPDVAASLCSLAALYRAQLRQTDAETLLGRAIAISERTLGTEHPQFALYLNALAELYRDTGRVTDAEPLLDRANTILTRKGLSPSSTNHRPD